MLPYLKCVLRVVDGPILWPFYGLYCNWVSSLGPRTTKQRSKLFFYWNPFIFVGYRNNRFSFHTNPYISNVTQQGRFLYFELGQPVTILACITGLTGALRAKRDERSISKRETNVSREARGREKIKPFIFFSSPHLALHAKWRVRLAWLIKRLLCAYGCRLLQYRLVRSAPRCLSNFGVFLGDAETIVSSLWLSHPFALQEETTKFSDQLMRPFFSRSLRSWQCCSQRANGFAAHSPASAPRALLQLFSLDHLIALRHVDFFKI